uniref:Uncharacterized protein n=1 Tax=Ditylenchus dipsaci TaxID=166011 RepID=A0A915E1I2_9BILA
MIIININYIEINSETQEKFQAIGKNDQRFFRDVVLLKGINAVVANNLSQQANVTSNELSSSLPDSGQFATAYRDTFKQDYGIVKEIHVIPIAEYSITDINHVGKRCVVGVLHKVDGRLSGHCSSSGEFYDASGHRKNDQRFFRDLVLLKGINALVANNLSQQAHVTSNE